MQFNVVSGGTIGFNSLLYPEKSPENKSYFRKDLDNLNNSEIGYRSRFTEDVNKLIESISSSKVANIVKKTMSGVSGALRQDIIVELSNVRDIQQAPVKMRRYLMVQEDVRELFNQGLCSGYDTTYVDYNKDTEKYDNPDYCKVMDGVVQVNDDDEYYITFNSYSGYDADGDLSHDDKVSIINTWELMKLAIENGDDPTDPDGGIL